MMRVFFLGGKDSQELPLDYLARRWEDVGELEERFRERAIEIAPGVKVALESTGGGVIPGKDGKNMFPGFGGRLLVFTEEE